MLEIVPGCDAFFFGAAFGLGLIGADEDMTIDAINREVADAFG
jgi:hypothetical protein